MKNRDRLSGSDVRNLAQALKRWADTTQLQHAGKLLVDLPDTCAASLVIVDCVRRLVSEPPPSRDQQAEILVELQAWLYDELRDHLDRLEAPLELVLEELHRDPSP